jgi:Glyoxalase superfamily protein
LLTVQLSGEGVGNAGADEDFAVTKETVMRDYRDAKAMAKAMREALAEREASITHSEALEIIARQFGLPNWNVLSAKIAEDEEARSETAILLAHRPHL